MGNKKKRRVKRDKRVPLGPTLGFSIPLGFAKGYSGAWASVAEAIQRGQPMHAIQSAILSLTGIAVGMPGTGYTGPAQVEMHKLLNPFEFTSAGAIKGLMLGALVSTVFGTKLGVNRSMKKIPFVGKYIKL